MTKPKRRQSSNSSLQPQPSTSKQSTTSLIKEITTHSLFRECLADMMVKCLVKIQNRLSELSDQIADLQQLFTQNEKAITDLKSCVAELKMYANECTVPENVESKSLLLRVHGINTESGNICEQFCHLVSTKMAIPCDQSKFSLVEESASSTPRTNSPTRGSQRAPITIEVQDKQLHDSIYKGRTLLKGTSIYISEVLSKSEQFLFYLSRNIKKANKISAAWTYKCTVYIRTLDNAIKAIKCPSDLAEF